MRTEASFIVGICVTLLLPGLHAFPVQTSLKHVDTPIEEISTSTSVGSVPLISRLEQSPTPRRTAGQIKRTEASRRNKVNSLRSTYDEIKAKTANINPIDISGQDQLDIQAFRMRLQHKIDHYRRYNEAYMPSLREQLVEMREGLPKRSDCIDKTDIEEKRRKKRREDWKRQYTRDKVRRLGIPFKAATVSGKAVLQDDAPDIIEKKRKVNRLSSRRIRKAKKMEREEENWKNRIEQVLATGWRVKGQRGG